ncbi:MAG TPA: ATP-binding protein [Longimicrobiaceae bacterium]
MVGTVLEELTGLDVLLLVLAVLLALALHRTAVSVSRRLACTRGTPYFTWLGIGSLALGAGLWALGVTTILPLAGSSATAYAIRPGGVAAALAMVGTCAALSLLSLPRPLWLRAGIGGVSWGAALALIHYLDLDALGWRSAFARDPALAAQVAAATIAAGVLLVVATSLAIGEGVRRRWWEALGALVALGAVPAAFYSALIATRYAPVPPGHAPGTPILPIDATVAVSIASGALLLLVIVLLAAGIDRRLRDHQEETEALRRSQDRFRSLTQASAQIVWTTAPNGEMVGDQPSWSQFTGQDVNAYRGWGWFNAIHPDDREATASVWQESLANRKPIEVEHRVRRFDGLYRDCVARMVPVLEPDGSVREWVGTHTDVTERARMQEERELLAGAGRVLSSSLDERETLGAIAGLLVPRLADWCAIDLRTADGRIERVVATHADPHLSTLLMRIEHDFSGGGPGHGVARVLATGESEMIREVGRDVLRAMAADEENYRRLNDVGVCSLLSVPLTARNQVLGVLTLALAKGGEPYDLRDLALAEELGRRSAIAIDNARLYSAAREAIQARDEMMSIVSHDLRNPLSTVMMTADLLVENPGSPDAQRRHLDTVRRAAAAMNRLIQDLLDVSQTESGSLSMDLRPVDPGEIAIEACEAMGPLAAEKGQRLACDVEAGLPLIEADAARIQQVLSNLLGNAVKFVGEGGEIRVNVGEREGAVLFSVDDTGPGIPREDLPRVFDRHWRAKQTAHLGAGLGLAISKAIVEAHGGEIWAESEPGRGTSFRFKVPVAERVSESERSGAERSSGTSPRDLGASLAVGDG